MHFLCINHIISCCFCLWKLWFYGHLLQKLGILDENERLEDQMLFDIVFRNSELSPISLGKSSELVQSTC